MRLQDEVVLVTGAARGLGASIAEECAAEGAHVILGDVSEAEVIAVADRLTHSGASVLPLTMDVTSGADVRSAVRVAIDWKGKLSGLVNNAGVLIESTAVTATEEDWIKTFDVNLKGVWMLCREVIPQMLDQGGGSIVNMSSIEGLFARPNHMAYAVTKAGLLNLTRSVAVDFGRSGIRCNAICPGSIDTALLRQHINATEDPIATGANLIGRNFAGRFGTVQEVAKAATFLLSDESSFTNGTYMVVDGARTANT